jgi:hypothetical protein
MNIYIDKLDGLSILVYAHRANDLRQWKVYTLAEVPESRKEQARVKQERIASKRNCIVETVEINRPPWTVDVLVSIKERI